MMRRHTKVSRADEDEYRPRHLRDSRNTRNDLDLRDPPDAETTADGGEAQPEDA